MEFAFRRWRVKTIWSQYVQGDKTALRLIDAISFDPIATATVNVVGQEVNLGPDDILVKAWSENEGMVEALAAGGVIESNPAPIAIPVGRVEAFQCRLTLKAIQERDATFSMLGSTKLKFIKRNSDSDE
jgi:hypothetical protein